jgi:hypothetical protein
MDEQARTLHTWNQQLQRADATATASTFTAAPAAAAAAAASKCLVAGAVDLSMPHCSANTHATGCHS